MVELDDADFTTLEHLNLVDGQIGLWVHNGSTNFTGSDLTITGHVDDGVRIESNSTVTKLERITASHTGGYGIYVDGLLGSLTGSTIHHNGDTGIRLNNPGNAIIEANESYNNGGYGIYLNDSTGQVVIGNADLSLGRGNRIHDNASDGVYALGDVTVAGNTIYGHTGTGRVGLRLVGADAYRNVVHGNRGGLLAGYRLSTRVPAFRGPGSSLRPGAE